MSTIFDSFFILYWGLFVWLLVVLSENKCNLLFVDEQLKRMIHAVAHVLRIFLQKFNKQWAMQNVLSIEFFFCVGRSSSRWVHCGKHWYENEEIGLLHTWIYDETPELILCSFVSPNRPRDFYLIWKCETFVSPDLQKVLDDNILSWWWDQLQWLCLHARCL